MIALSNNGSQQKSQHGGKEWYMLNKALELTLNDAFRLARERHHELMTVEHLLVALLDNPDAAEVLVRNRFRTAEE